MIIIFPPIVIPGIYSTRLVAVRHAMMLIARDRLPDNALSADRGRRRGGRAGAGARAGACRPNAGGAAGTDAVGSSEGVQEAEEARLEGGERRNVVACRTRTREAVAVEATRRLFQNSLHVGVLHTLWVTCDRAIPDRSVVRTNVDLLR